MTNNNDYRYRKFTTKLLLRDMRFHKSAPNLTHALDDLVLGKPQQKTQSQKMLLPVVRAMGYVQEVMQRGGPSAVRELWLAAFPMALAGRPATLFQPLPEDLRGIASASTLGVAMFAIAVFVLW